MAITQNKQTIYSPYDEWIHTFPKLFVTNNRSRSFYDLITYTGRGTYYSSNKWLCINIIFLVYYQTTAMAFTVVIVDNDWMSFTKPFSLNRNFLLILIFPCTFSILHKFRTTFCPYDADTQHREDLWRWIELVCAVKSRRTANEGLSQKRTYLMKWFSSKSKSLRFLKNGTCFRLFAI